MKRLFVLFCLPLLLTACDTDHGTFTVLSNKIVNVNDFNIEKTEHMKNISGEDQADIIVIVPTKTNPNLSGALNDAFRKTNGDVMTDVTVHSSSWYIPYIYGQTTWSVRGDVVKTRNN